MAVSITSSLRIGLVSGTGVSFSAPVVPALTTDDVYNVNNPSETLTTMFDGIVTGPMNPGAIPKAVTDTELGDSLITDDGESISFAGPIMSAADSSGVTPASTTTAGWAMTSNYGTDATDSVRDEVDFWNTVEDARVSFSWWQKRAAGAPFNMMNMYGDATSSQIDVGTLNTTVILGTTEGVEAFFGSVSPVPVNFYVYNRNSMTLPVEGGVQITGVNFADLPTGVAGMIAYVKDSSTNVWGATITGGGGNDVMAFFNGINWTVMAK